MRSSMTIEITGSMEALLDWFADQPCSCATIGHIENELEYTRETIRSNLKVLMAGDHAEQRYKPTGEYRLISDPRTNDK